MLLAFLIYILSFLLALAYCRYKGHSVFASSLVAVMFSVPLALIFSITYGIIY